MLTIHPTEIAGLLVVETRWFSDERGAFSETYHQQRFAEAGIDAVFMQDNHAWSRQKGTLRGLHFQLPPAAQNKLVRVTRGAIFDVAVDLRAGSASFGRWAGVVLSARNRWQLFVPKGFAHGYLTLEEESEVVYKVDNPYRPELERGLRWDDPAVGIDWPDLGRPPVIANRDRALPLLEELTPAGETP